MNKVSDSVNDNYLKLQQSAIRLLSRREHSQFELTQKLLAKVQDEALVNSVVQEMQQAGYQSDARFTESWVYHRKQKGYGPNKVLFELRGQQVASQLIADFLDLDDIEWYDLALKQRQKHFAHPPSTPQEKAKQSRYLYNRGFTSSQISAAMKIEEP